MYNVRVKSFYLPYVMIPKGLEAASKLVPSSSILSSPEWVDYQL